MDGVWTDSATVVWRTGRVLRKKKNKRPAHTARKRITPTAMPAIAAVDSVGDDWLADEKYSCESVADGEATIEDASLGTGSPGASWKSALAAASICSWSVCVSLGLMTPTICFPLHESGAAQ